MQKFIGIRTPCIGVCSTGIGDSVCRGCKRFDYEVINWNGFTQEQKSAIDCRLSDLLAQVVAWRFLIFDLEKLKFQLRLQNIFYQESRDPYCWLYELLRAGAKQIKSTNDFGFQKISSFEHKNLDDLRRDIDEEFYSLSVAHYERYVLANQKRAKVAQRESVSDE